MIDNYAEYEVRMAALWFDVEKNSSRNEKSIKPGLQMLLTVFLLLQKAPEGLIWREMCILEAVVSRKEGFLFGGGGRLADATRRGLASSRTDCYLCESKY